MDWGKMLEVILVAVIPLVVPPLVAWLAAIARNAWADFAERRPDAAYYLEQAAAFAVIAAEQAGAAKLIEDKKQYALSVAEKWLELRGVKIDLDLLSAAIEKAVREELKQKAVPMFDLEG